MLTAEQIQQMRAQAGIPAQGLGHVQSANDRIASLKVGAPQQPVVQMPAAPAQPTFPEKVRNATSDVLKGAGEGIFNTAKGALDYEKKAMSGQNVGFREGLKPAEAVLRTAGGAITAAFSGVAGAIGAGTNAIADKVGDIPAVQKFASTPTMDHAAHFAQKISDLAAKHPEATKDLSDIANIFATVYGGKIPEIKTATSKPLVEVTSTIGKDLVATNAEAAQLPSPIKTAGKAVVDKVRQSPKTEKYVTDLANDYRKAAGHTIKPSKTLAKAEARGKDPAQFLAERNIRPDVKEGKMHTEAQQATLVKSVEPLNKHLEMALDEVQGSVPRTKLADMEARAIKLARSDKNIADNTANAKVRDIRREFANYRANYGNEITLRQVNDIKKGKWAKTPFDSTKPYQGEVNYSIGKAAQQTIEDTVPKNLPVHELNSHIGDYYEAMKFLDSLNNRAVVGGRLGKYTARTVGAIIGHGTGGPVGSIVGAMGGDAVAEIMQQTSFSNPLKQLILKNLEKSDPAAYQQTLKYIKDAQLERQTRLQIEAPKTKPEPPIELTAPGILQSRENIKPNMQIKGN